MYLSPSSYEMQGEYVRPANRKFRVTIPKETLRDHQEPAGQGGSAEREGSAQRRTGFLILLNALPLLLLAGVCNFS